MPAWASRITGSSPRMRGTPQPATERGCSHRIIPAYAGNTPPCRPGRPESPDHPRVCGEHLTLPPPASLYCGSSPRMRGTRDGEGGRLAAVRIIPAYAGNTHQSHGNGGMSPDHPRVCGEHLSIHIVYNVIIGSSPRMRGTLVRASSRSNS